MRCCLIETSSDFPRKYSAIFGFLRKSSEIFGKCSETLVWPSDKFLKVFQNWSEIFGKSSKTLSVCLYNKQNNTWLLVDMEYIFSCSTFYLTRSLRSLMIYRVEHSKIYSISTRVHVLSPYEMYYPPMRCIIPYEWDVILFIIWIN